MCDIENLPQLSESETSSSDESTSTDDEEPQVAPIKVEKPDNDDMELEFKNNPGTSVTKQIEKKTKLTEKMLSEWPLDDLYELVDRIKDALPETESIKFTKQVKKIVWDDIAFNEYSANDCSLAWLVIQKRIRKNRILKEVLCDAKPAILSIHKRLNKKPNRRHPEQPKRPLSAYMLFCSDKREEVNRENPGIKNVDAVKLMGQMYRNLSEVDRKLYLEKAEEVKKVYNGKLKEFHGKYPTEVKQSIKPQTPFQLYYESEIKAAPDSSDSESVLKKQYKEKWKNLGKEEKVVFINLALENEQKFKNEHPDPDVKHKFKSVLSKEEQSLSDELAGKPKKPPHSAYGLFTQIELKKDEMKKKHIKERMRIVGARWTTCPPEIKARLSSETSELKAKYKLDYEAYLKSLPEDQRQKVTKSKKRKLTEKASKVLKKKKVETPVRNNLERPEIPPLAPELFAQSLSDKNVNFEQAWTDLNQTERNKFKRKSNQLQKKYLADFEVYAKATMMEKLKMEQGSSNLSSSEDESENSSSSTCNENGNVKSSSSSTSSSSSSSSEESDNDEDISDEAD